MEIRTHISNRKCKNFIFLYGNIHLKFYIEETQKLWFSYMEVFTHNFIWKYRKFYFLLWKYALNFHIWHINFIFICGYMHPCVLTWYVENSIFMYGSVTHFIDEIWKGWNSASFSNVILEVIKEVSQKHRQIPCDVTYMWKVKYDTNDFICERETDSQIPRKKQIHRYRGKRNRFTDIEN